MILKSVRVKNELDDRYNEFRQGDSALRLNLHEFGR